MNMTPKETRNNQLGERLVKKLAQRHYEAYYCPTAQEAVEKALSLIEENSTITWGGSMTIRDTGLIKALYEAGKYKLLDRETLTDRAEIMEMYRQAFYADVYLTSANAISEDGEIVNIDGNGNRVAAITFGPKKVIFMIGINKVCGTLDAAIVRARTTAAPINAARFDINTPCHADGCCHDCHSPQCICNYIHVMRNSYPAMRHTVILIGEEAGY